MISEEKKQLFIVKMRDYINQNTTEVVREVVHPELIDELRKFSKKEVSRPEKIYLECLKLKHFKFAYDISRKYGWMFRRPADDISTAIGFALLASKDVRL